MMNKKYIIFIALLFLVPAKTFGAQIFFGSHENIIAPTQKFEVGVFLDTHNESVNALEGQIIFPSDMLEFNGLYTGSSVLPFWVESPKLLSDGVISFSGIVPGGFSGSKGYLFSLLFTAKKAGPVIISTSQERILLNDGAGSATKVTKAPLSITIEKQAEESLFAPKYDADPPELFIPEVSQDSTIFNDQYFLTFATQDKGSGVDHYEIKESEPWYSFRWLFSFAPWQIAQSPYALKDQTLRSVILVKAIDFAGNETFASVSPLHNFPWYENYIIWIIIIVIVAVMYLGKRFYFKK